MFMPHYLWRLALVQFGEVILQLIELELVVMISVELLEGLFELCPVHYVGMPQIKDKTYFGYFNVGLFIFFACFQQPRYLF